MRRLVAIVLSLFVFASCSYGIKYEDESVKTKLVVDSDIADELTGMIRKLTVNSPIIPEFNNITEAMEGCRDAVLYSMLMENYGKYTGDIEKLDAAVAEYPRMQITNFIPAREFEETVYALFGGTRKVTNESGRLFVYLERVAGYTSVTILDTKTVEVEVSSLYETENTYRMSFFCSSGDITSPEYDAIFVKRDDGTVYFYRLSEKI